MNSPHSSTAGFTLTELLIVVAVVGILVSLALPSFGYLTQSQRVKNASFELYALLSIARSEAIKRNHDVVAAPVMVGSAVDRIEVTDSIDGSLIYSKAMPKGVDFDVSAPSITYKRTGRTSTGSSITFQIDVQGAATPTAHVRCITLGLNGMPQTRKGACS